MNLRILIFFTCIVTTCAFLLACDQVKELVTSKDGADSKNKTSIEIKASYTAQESKQAAKSDLGNAVISFYQGNIDSALKFADQFFGNFLIIFIDGIMPY